MLQSFGDPNWQSWVLDEEKSLPILKAAYDRGINAWDTGTVFHIPRSESKPDQTVGPLLANIYSNGASEKIIGKALKVMASHDTKLY